MNYNADHTLTGDTVDQFVDSWMPTSYMVDAVLNCTDDQGLWMWESVSATRDEAREFYFTTLTDEDERRYYAAEVLENAGWTVRRVDMRKA